MARAGRAALSPAMNNTHQAPNPIEAALNYAERGRVSRLVPIHDGRAILEELSLERQGFELRHRATAVTNFDDPDEVREVYYPEVEQLLKDATGATRAVAFEHDVRRTTAP